MRRLSSDIDQQIKVKTFLWEILQSEVTLISWLMLLLFLWEFPGSGVDLLLLLSNLLKHLSHPLLQ